MLNILICKINSLSVLKVNCQVNNWRKPASNGEVQYPPYGFNAAYISTIFIFLNLVDVVSLNGYYGLITALVNVFAYVFDSFYTIAVLNVDMGIENSGE